MGTEVLHPYDILSRGRLGSSPSTAAAAVVPRRRHTTSVSPASKPNPRRLDARKRREGSPRPAKNGGGGGLEIGQVTILRRGETRDMPAKGLTVEERRGGAGAAGGMVAFGTGLLGPKPAEVPRQMRLGKVRTGAEDDGKVEYAGSAFSLSPSPRALPLPTFSPKRLTGGCGEEAVDLFATRDLRRLLRLD